jgi:hypothetical protein
VKVQTVLFWTVTSFILFYVVNSVSEELVVSIFRFHPEEGCCMFPQNVGENLQFGFYLAGRENTSNHLQFKVLL